MTNFGGAGVSVIDVQNGRLVADIRTGVKPHGVVIAPDGKTVYVPNEGDGTLLIIDLSHNAIVATATRTLVHPCRWGALPNQVIVGFFAPCPSISVLAVC